MKTNTKTKRAMLAFLAGAAVASCGGGADQAREGGTSFGGQSPPPLSVYVVNYPLASFAERIGGSAVSVTFPAPADGDPAQWSPDAGTVAGYQGADPTPPPTPAARPGAVSPPAR